MYEQRIDSVFDPFLSARVVRRLSLVYEGGADAELDRPRHVRAGSGLAWVGDKLAVVQDDANFVALVNTTTGIATALTLPHGPGGLRQFDDGRGNKLDKFDFESLFSFAEENGVTLVGLGSGSSNRRESILFVQNATAVTPVIRVVHVPEFYTSLRACAAFAGSELNIEGVVHGGETLRIFNRGNGAQVGGAQPVNATCDVSFRELLAHLKHPSAAELPALTNVWQYDLGRINGTPLTFTDATVVGFPDFAMPCNGGLVHRGGTTVGFGGDSVRPADPAVRYDGDSVRVSNSPAAPDSGIAHSGVNRATEWLLYTATAEASPDATRDGPVSGSAIGVIEQRDGVPIARWTTLRNEHGEPVLEKVEGIAINAAGSDTLFVVVDTDKHDCACELFEVRLQGPWRNR